MIKIPVRIPHSLIAIPIVRSGLGSNAKALIHSLDFQYS